MGALKTELQRDLLPRRRDVSLNLPIPGAGTSSCRIVLGEDAFVSMLYLERRRAERAEKRFMLMLVDVKRATAEGAANRILAKITNALASATRETDIIGWYLEGSLIGVIGTEIGDTPPGTVQERMLQKVRESFLTSLGQEKASLVTVSFHFFPEEFGDNDADHSANIALYPDLSRKEESRRLELGVKRAMDICGSALALLIFSPFLAVIAAAIKLTSKGPVLFKQERLGQYGKTFTVLKFRSMRTDCDPRIHQEYVKQFIAGEVSGNSHGGEKPVYKIQKDPRITSVGALLRKTSLDEFPQFWNVLVGDMSLVGPRPPVAYEFKAYDAWHRRRVLEIKPGITGLWQVEGRSRTRFDDMVRLDLKYAQAWSVWLDMRILLQTPAAVLSGDGAH